jgi:sec-independent protein translocase protein TatB
MFNVGPMEFLVLAVVGLIVLGPDRLPGLARDAARMIKTLRELSTGARTQLREELGPEFADLDLKSLNPRTALQRMLLGDDDAAPPARSTPPVPPGTAAPFDADAT